MGIDKISFFDNDVYSFYFTLVCILYALDDREGGIEVILAKIFAVGVPLLAMLSGCIYVFS